MSITFSFGKRGSPLDQRREINYCNGNAAIMLAAMGIPFDHCGEMSGADFCHRAWVAYDFDDLTLGRLVRPESQDGVVVTCGLDLSDIRDRLFRLASMGPCELVTWG